MRLVNWMTCSNIINDALSVLAPSTLIHQPTQKHCLKMCKKLKLHKGRKRHGNALSFCPECQLPLLWYKHDIVEEEQKNTAKDKQFGAHTTLYCRQCYFHTEPGQLILTRDHLEHEPPDLLFTTTEMLNRYLSQAGKHKLIGVDVEHAPRLLLLDEIPHI